MTTQLQLINIIIINPGILDEMPATTRQSLEGYNTMDIIKI